MGKVSFGKKLTIMSNREIVHISVTHDKTKKQREEYQKLSSQLEERVKNSEENIGIRNNRIVKNFQNHSRGTRIAWAQRNMIILYQR